MRSPPRIRAPELRVVDHDEAHTEIAAAAAATSSPRTARPARPVVVSRPYWHGRSAAWSSASERA